MTLPIAYKTFYRENITVIAQNPINATHVEVSLSGNGTLTLPNSTETIAVNSTGTALVNFETTSVIAQQFLTSEDGSENASATIYEIQPLCVFDLYYCLFLIFLSFNLNGPCNLMEMLESSLWSEVVGSTPTTRSTFINLDSYGIKLCLFLEVVGQKA
jgi:hypothetical protein